MSDEHNPGPETNLVGMEWDYNYPDPIKRGDVRVYEGRKFEALQDIPAGGSSNAPNYSGMWKEVE